MRIVNCLNSLKKPGNDRTETKEVPQFVFVVESAKAVKNTSWIQVDSSGNT